MKFLNHKNNRRGFTLIELLVVISIVSLLSSVVLASVSGVRAKARDAQRISDVRQIQNALELYYETNQKYPDYAPPISYYYARSQSSGSENECGYLNSPTYTIGIWCLLENVLNVYINKLPRTTVSGSTYYYYIYKRNAPTASNGYLNSYGLGVLTETSNTASINDGGYFNNMFEVGDYPIYCKSKYSGSSANWTTWDYSNVCVGGN